MTGGASANAIAAAVADGKTSASGVIDQALARIDQRNPVLNAFTAITAERARTRAAAIDVARAYDLESRGIGHAPIPPG